jgi:hypothetical protein
MKQNSEVGTTTCVAVRTQGWKVVAASEQVWKAGSIIIFLAVGFACVLAEEHTCISLELSLHEDDR